MAVLKEISFDVPLEKRQEVMEYFKELYIGKPNEEKVQRELGQVVISLLSDHIPITLEVAYDFLPGLLKIIPELKPHLDTVPERTNEYIGWFSYNPNQALFPDKLAGSFNDALSDYSGPVYAIDVFSNAHSEVGIVFTSKPIEQANGDAYFEDMLRQVYAEGDDDDEIDFD